MNEESQKMDLWQLVTILIVVLALFGGQYMVNQAIDSRLDSLESTITGTGDALGSAIDRIYIKLERMEKNTNTKIVETAAAPAPAEPEKTAQEAQDAEQGTKGKAEQKAEEKAE